MSTYVCPMHQDVRLADHGNCPVCGMALVPDDASFPLLRHLTSDPRMLAVMFAAMFAIMVALMLLMR